MHTGRLERLDHCPPCVHARELQHKHILLIHICFLKLTYLDSVAECIAPLPQRRYAIDFTKQNKIMHTNELTYRN